MEPPPRRRVPVLPSLVLLGAVAGTVVVVVWVATLSYPPSPVEDFPQTRLGARSSTAFR